MKHRLATFLFAITSLALIVAPVSAYWQSRQQYITGAAYSPPLDGISNVQAAYSCQLLKTGATNSFRVHRTSDSTETDIGFVGSACDAATYATFCNATTCYIVKAYDQSGNGNDLTNNVNDIVLNSSGINSKGTWTFASGALISSNLTLTAKYTSISVAKSSATASYQFILSGDTFPTARVAQYMRLTSGNFECVGFSTIVDVWTASQAATFANPNVYSSITDASNTTVWVNGSAGTPVAVVNTPASGTGPIYMGGADNVGSFPFHGEIAVTILINTNTTADRATIETALRTYYGI